MREDFDSALWINGQLHPMVREVAHYDGTRDQYGLRYDYLAQGRQQRTVGRVHINFQDMRAARRELLTTLENDLETRRIDPSELEPLPLPAGAVAFDWTKT